MMCSLEKLSTHPRTWKHVELQVLRMELSKHPHTSWSFSALLVGRAPAYLVPRRVATKQWLQMAVDCNGHRLLNPGIHHPFQQRTGKEDKGVLLQGLCRPNMADQSEAKQRAQRPHPRCLHVVRMDLEGSRTEEQVCCSCMPPGHCFSNIDSIDEKQQPQHLEPNHGACGTRTEECATNLVKEATVI